jgi:flagellar protein FlaG
MTEFKRGSIEMDFDSLKAVSGNGNVKNDYSTSTKKVYEKETVKADSQQAAESATVDKTKVSEKASDAGKYSQDDLYKGENFQQKMEQAIAEANKILKPTNKSFQYSVHDETHEIMIQVKDNDTGEVIKEIPSEESLDRVAKMRELAGIVIDEKR